MTASTFDQEICIDAAHPALAGHFPGRPVVPGVVLLDQVAIALHNWRSEGIGTLTQVKFLHPLLPGQPASLSLADNGKSIRFGITRAGIPIASGVIETSLLAPHAAEPV